MVGNTRSGIHVQWRLSDTKPTRSRTVKKKYIALGNLDNSLHCARHAQVLNQHTPKRMFYSYWNTAVLLTWPFPASSKLGWEHNRLLWHILSTSFLTRLLHMRLMHGSSYLSLICPTPKTLEASREPKTSETRLSRLWADTAHEHSSSSILVLRVQQQRASRASRSAGWSIKVYTDVWPTRDIPTGLHRQNKGRHSRYKLAFHKLYMTSIIALAESTSVKLPAHHGIIGDSTLMDAVGWVWGGGPEHSPGIYSRGSILLQI